MPWVGVIAPDRLSVVRPIGTDVITAWAANQGNPGTGPVTITVPSGVSEGDLMMFTCIMVPRFENFVSSTIPAGITLLVDPSWGATGARTVVGYKYADATDAAGGNNYTFSASNPGGLGYGRATLVSFPSRFGTTPTTAQVDTTSTPSIAPTPGAAWYFVAGMGGRPGGEQPVFTMTSVGDLLFSSTESVGTVAIRDYSAPNTVSPITGTYSNPNSYPAMAVIGIT